MARGPYVKTCMSGRVQKLVSRQNLALLTKIKVRKSQMEIVGQIKEYIFWGSPEYPNGLIIELCTLIIISKTEGFSPKS